MALSKTYSRINWENEPSVRSPLSEGNLNRMDYALNEVDNRVINLDTIKADEDDMLLAFKSISFDENTGIFTFTRFNGTIVTIDTLLEKVVTNWDYDDNPSSTNYQKLIITTQDGVVKYIDLSALITQYEFVDTDTVAFTIGADGKVSAEVIDGSITESKLSLTYKAQLDQKVLDAQGYAQNSSDSAIRAESFAVGGTGTRADEDTDNAKYYKEWVEDAFNRVLPTVFLDFSTGMLMYTGSALSFDLDTTTGMLEWNM